MQRINLMLDSTAKAYPDVEAIIFDDTVLTFEELNNNVNKLANGLKKLGIDRGDLVMVQLRVSVSLSCAYNFCLFLNAIVSFWLLSFS